MQSFAYHIDASSKTTLQNRIENCTTAESSASSIASGEMKVDEHMVNTTVTLGASELASILPTVAQSSFGTSSDTLVTRTVESKSSFDFDVPTKKLAPLSVGTSHEKPTSRSMVSNPSDVNLLLLGSDSKKMNNNSTTTTAIVSSTTKHLNRDATNNPGNFII